jgi:hypothetical protein
LPEFSRFVKQKMPHSETLDIARVALQGMADSRVPGAVEEWR